MSDGLRERFGIFRRQVANREDIRHELAGRKRRRIQLRLHEPLLKQLAIIKQAEGEVTTKFCEVAIAEAAAKRIGDLRRRYDDATWAVITQAAERAWTKKAAS